MPLSIEEGKVHVAALLTAEAEEQGVKLKDVQWEQAKDPFSLKATNAVTGKTADKRFSVKHLTHCKEDSQMKMQVSQKIVGLIVQLKPIWER